jgi:hypothetical protein
MNYDIAINNLKQILSLSGKNSRIILTSRPMFFKDAEHILSNMMESENEIKGFDVFTLLPFNLKQIELLLAKKYPETWETYLNLIMKNDLSAQIASRPLMIEIITKALPEPKINRPNVLNPVELYQSYIMNEWIEKSHIDADPELKNQILGFFKELAWDIQNSTSLENICIKPIDFQKRFEQSFPNADFCSKLQQIFVLDKDSGGLLFPHQSFQEYLVAEKLFEYLKDSSFDSVMECTITDGTLEFLKGRLQLNRDIEFNLVKLLSLVKTDDHIKILKTILFSLGNGDPIKAAISFYTRTNVTWEELNEQNIKIFESEKFISTIEKQLSSNTNNNAKHFLLELLYSKEISTQDALRLLLKQIQEDNNSQIKLHAIEVMSRRKGDDEIKIIISLIENSGNEYELRKKSLESLYDISREKQELIATIINLCKRFIFDKNDYPHFQKACVRILTLFNTNESLNPLLGILKDFTHNLWLATVAAIEDITNYEFITSIETKVLTQPVNASELDKLQNKEYLKNIIENKKKK